jgi:hypothetical protein
MCKKKGIYETIEQARELLQAMREMTELCYVSSTEMRTSYQDLLTSLEQFDQTCNNHAIFKHKQEASCAS